MLTQLRCLQYPCQLTLHIHERFCCITFKLTEMMPTVCLGEVFTSNLGALSPPSSTDGLYSKSSSSPLRVQSEGLGPDTVLNMIVTVTADMLCNILLAPWNDLAQRTTTL